MIDFPYIKDIARETPGKIVMLVVDGLGGLPLPETGRSELETAVLPNLDALARSSAAGLTTPVATGITPGSGPGHTALFGYDPVTSMIGRGVLSALGVVLAGNIVHAAVFFILALGGIAGFYLMLSVEFLALVQLIVYGGAVTILILFALMLTRARERPQALFGKTRPLGVVAALGLLAAFIGASVGTDWFEQTPRGDIEPVPFQELGDVIFTVWIRKCYVTC